MAVAADGEVVIARIDDVGAGAVCVIHAHIFFGDGKLHHFRLARLEEVRLAEGDQFRGRFFDGVLLIVIGIRGLHVDLYHLFARRIARVSDLDGDGEGVVARVQREVGILELRIREAEAEGIDDRLFIVVIAGVARAHHFVGIAGLVILVADVDVFRVVVIVLSRLFVNVREGEIAEVDHGGGGEIVVYIGVYQPARRVVFAAQQFGDGAQALLAARTHPEDGYVFIQQRAALHGVHGVEQDDDFIEVFQCRADEGHLVVAEFQHGLIGVFDGGSPDVVAFLAHAADEDDGGVVIVFPRIVLGGGVCGKRGLADVVAALARGALARAFEVEIEHDGVDGKARVFKHFLHGRFQRGIDGRRAAAADVEGAVCTGRAEQRDALCVFEGQVLVLQQHAALRLYLLGEHRFVRLQFFQTVVIGLIVDAVDGIFFVVYHLIRFLPQIDCDDLRVLQQHGRRQNGH